ncbi:MAG: hypothetical protein K2P06_04645, partial [Muribaculaceae bacterium]|nr:hypothetical protein [Muribaculaceae bacterium]
MNYPKNRNNRRTPSEGLRSDFSIFSSGCKQPNLSTGGVSAFFGCKVTNYFLKLQIFDRGTAPVS